MKLRRNRFWRRADRILDRLILICFLGVLTVGAYTVYDNLYLRGTDLKKIGSFFSQENETSQQMPENAVGWLKICDSYIDLPIMQGKDNYEYLNKDPEGEFALSGSVFLDFRNHADWSDSYNLLYGHHMSGNRMFGSLDLFLEESYFEAHRKGVLKTPGKDYELTVFSVALDQASQKAVFEAGEKGQDADAVCAYLKKHAVIYREPDGEQVLALSTCKVAGSTQRLIVFAAMRPMHGKTEE